MLLELASKRKTAIGFLRSLAVLKGIRDCRNEAAIYKARGGKLNPLAPDDWQGRLVPCRLVTILGVPCLIMQLIDRSETKNWKYEEFPKWSIQLNDGRQIGRTKKGELAVYDYGGEIYEEWTPKREEIYLNGMSHLVDRLIQDETQGVQL